MPIRGWPRRKSSRRGHPEAVTACGITTGAGKIPFICFDLAGGGNIAGSNVLVGGPKGQLDFLSVAGYSKLGLPGTMVPNPSATGNFIDSTFGLRFHADSAHLRGMKTARQDGIGHGQHHGHDDSGAVAERHQYQSAQPDVRHLCSTARAAACSTSSAPTVSMSGGNSMAPMTMMIAERRPGEDLEFRATARAWSSTGQLTTLLPPLPNGTTGRHHVMESMKRISDAKYAKVTAYTNATANAAALGNGTTIPGIAACGYTKAAYVVDTVQQPVGGESGRRPEHRRRRAAFSRTAEYQANSDFQKTAAIMKLVIDGNAAAGTIEMGGFDYHTGDRIDR